MRHLICKIPLAAWWVGMRIQHANGITEPPPPNDLYLLFANINSTKPSHL